MFNGPAYRFSGEEWHQRVISQCDAFSNLLLFTYQFDECVVDRQAIELWAVYRTECFKVCNGVSYPKVYAVQDTAKEYMVMAVTGEAPMLPTIII